MDVVFEKLEQAAGHPKSHVGIIAGFFVRHAQPPSPETDGLNGLGQLAAGLTEAGIRVTAISDAPCAKAVWAVTKALPHGVGLEIVAVSVQSVRQLRRKLETDVRISGATSLSFVIHLEPVRSR